VEYVEETHPPNKDTLIKLLAAVDKRDKFRLFGKPVTDEQVLHTQQARMCFSHGSLCGFACCMDGHVCFIAPALATPTFNVPAPGFCLLSSTCLSFGCAPPA
jgi:hypothetical protein